MTAPFPVTSRQLEVLRFVAGFQAAHDGVSPTYADICAAFGFGSSSSAKRVLDALEERGWIRRLSRRARAIEVLAPVAIPRAPDGAPLFLVPAPVGPHCERTASHG